MLDGVEVKVFQTHNGRWQYKLLDPSVPRGSQDARLFADHTDESYMWFSAEVSGNAKYKTYLDASLAASKQLAKIYEYHVRKKLENDFYEANVQVEIVL